MVETYVDAKTKTKHHCLKHDECWNISPSNALTGKGCPQCLKERISSSLTIDHEEYVKRVKEQNPTVEVLEKYCGMNAPIEHRCLIHNEKWKTRPAAILRGGGCPRCKGERITAAKTRIHDEYLHDLSEKDVQVEPLEEYDGITTKIKHKCLIHGIEFIASPEHVLSEKGCPECRHDKLVAKLGLSHAEYLDRLHRVNPDIDLIANYKGLKTPVEHICRKHDIRWMVTPEEALREKGCWKCNAESHRFDAHFPNEWYRYSLELRNPDIEAIEDYVNSSTPIKHQCKIDGIIFDISPNNALHGKGCPVCSKNPHKYTPDLYDERLSRINPSLIRVGEFVNLDTYTEFKCSECGHVWSASPKRAIKGESVCPECFKKSLCLTEDEVKQQLANNVPHIELVGEYSKKKDKTLFYCHKHDRTWLSTLDVVVKSCGCPDCKKEAISAAGTMSHDEYVERLKIIHPDIEVVDQYQGGNIPLRHKCKKDGHIWKNKPVYILHGSGCPVCSETRGERKIRQWLEKHNIKFESEKRFDDCRDQHCLPFDFYIPDINTCLEYDGEHHFRAVDFSNRNHQRAVYQFKMIKKHDQMKNDYCEENGIRLIRIPYWYYDDIDHYLKDYLLV